MQNGTQNSVIDAYLKRELVLSLCRILFDSMGSANCRQVNSRVSVRHQQTVATVIHLQFIIVINLVAKKQAH